MPLDTGVFAEQAAVGQTTVKRPRLVLDPDMDVGAALKAARLSLGMTIEEISEVTRVRERHLAAIEAAAIDQLPSRPFTVGYVRAYAKALGLDADATAARFRAENPSPDDQLLAPVGVTRRQPVVRNRSFLGVLALVGLAVLGWNVARHAMATQTAKPPPAPHVAVARTNSVSGPFAVDAPLPAPPEATAPAPYITPVVGSNAPANTVAAQAAAAGGAASGAVTPFVAQGAVYGPSANTSGLIIQAKKSISLEVRGPGGVVYFARQLAAGEAYRVPALPNLTAEVSNPESAELYLNGVSKGQFTAAQMPMKAS
ncbi:MAG TPA: helix-turn-helix domain-containing protein [Caulobacteraceae bacterium]|jgi:cytoskeletal protein RodZ